MVDALALGMNGQKNWGPVRTHVVIGILTEKVLLSRSREEKY